MHVERNGLAGYYILDERRIPVFTHQLEAYEDLIAEAAGDLRGKALHSFFDYTPEPTPSSLVLSQLVAFVKEEGRPQYVPFQEDSTPFAVAKELLDGRHSERDRKDFIRSRWETGVACIVYPDLGQFEDAVQQAIDHRVARDGDHRGIEDDFRFFESDRPKNLLPFVSRDNLAELQTDVVTWIKLHLPHVAGRIEPVPPIAWTPKVVSTWYAKWTLQRRGATKGTEHLFVNLVLSTREKFVSDDVLRYLIYHEMLHHLLPLHGHDRTFRQLESRWTNAVALDAQLEALQDDWELGAARYRKRKLL
jgi:hypothetical protein